MNREQTEILSLLKEVDEICGKQGITYFLSPQLLLCGMTGQPFPQSPKAGVVLMKIPDMERFRQAALEEGREGRAVESMADSRRFPGFYLHYVNKNTLGLYLNEGGRLKYPGIAVKILPLRGKIPSRWLRLWNRAEEAGWICMNDPSPEKLGKKRRLCRMMMRARLLTGRGRLARSLYRHFCRRQDVPDTPEYELRLKKKAVSYPAEVFQGTREVTLEGYSFLAPDRREAYLSRYYGPDYRNKVFEPYRISPSELVSARVGYEDFFQETGRPWGFIRERNRQRKRNAFGKRQKRYLEDSWKYVKFCGERIQLEEYYASRKDYIKNLYENKDYPALEEALWPYHRAAVKGARRQELFVPDEEIFRIYLQVLEKMGRSRLKENLEKYWD